MPFDEEIEDLSKLKMFGKNEKSMFKPQIQDEDFEDKVKEIEKRKQKYRQTIANLSLQFKKIIEDKTLIQNKNELSKTIEADTLKEIVELAGKINADQNEQEGMGSLLLCTILLKALIIFRDRENSLEYKLHLLEKRIDEFPSLIEKRLERFNDKRIVPDTSTKDKES